MASLSVFFFWPQEETAWGSETTDHKRPPETTLDHMRLPDHVRPPNHNGPTDQIKPPDHILKGNSWGINEVLSIYLSIHPSTKLDQQLTLDHQTQTPPYHRSDHKKELRKNKSNRN